MQHSNDRKSELAEQPVRALWFPARAFRSLDAVLDGRVLIASSLPKFQCRPRSERNIEIVEMLALFKAVLACPTPGKISNLLFPRDLPLLAQPFGRAGPPKSTLRCPLPILSCTICLASKSIPSRLLPLLPHALLHAHVAVRPPPSPRIHCCRQPIT